MTNKELLEMYVKVRERIGILEEAADILADEPFASKESDNEEFCSALQMRIDNLLMMAERLENILCTTASEEK